MTNKNDLNKVIIQWVFQYLADYGYSLKNRLPEIVHDIPLPYVGRFATSEGYIYFKHTPNLIALEQPLSKFCEINSR